MESNDDGNRFYLLPMHFFSLQFPLTMFVVTGSQADRAEKNKITLLKLSDMHKTYVKPGRLVNYIHT